MPQKGKIPITEGLLYAKCDVNAFFFNPVTFNPRSNLWREVVLFLMDLEVEGGKSGPSMNQSAFLLQATSWVWE